MLIPDALVVGDIVEDEVDAVDELVVGLVPLDSVVRASVVTLSLVVSVVVTK
jgi:hypothetical protein